MNGFIICLVLALLNALLTLRNWSAALNRVGSQRTAGEDIRDYSYIDDDYPLYYPVSSGPLPDVAMTMYDSVHYSVDILPADNNSVASLEAEAEWALTATTPSSSGRVRLGPENRIFLITLWHQTHCLHSFQMALAGSVDRASDFSQYHIAHCLNYLRQWFLCTAAADLEEGDFLDGFLTEGDLELLPAYEREERRKKSKLYNESYSAGWNPGRIRGEQVCKDWEMLYSDLEVNNARWLEWAHKWN